MQLMKGLPIFLIFAALLSYMSFAQQPECDYKIEIMIEGDEFNPEDFNWRMKAIKIQGPSTNLTGTAKIEDSDGKLVKSYKPWTSDSIAKQKTSSEYSPNLKPGEHEITAEISVDCDDTNKDNNIDTKTITIKGENPEQKPKEETKQSTKTTAPKKITKASNEEPEIVPSEETETPLKTEAQKIETPKSKTEEFDNVIQLTSSKKSQKPQIQASAIQQPKVVYESSNEKAKGLILIFLLILSILLNIILIWRR